MSHEKDSLSVKLSERTERVHRLDQDGRVMEDKLNQLHHHNHELKRRVGMNEWYGIERYFIASIG